MEAIERQLEYYRTPDGRIPFHQWHDALRDTKTQAIVDARLARVRVGNLGFCRPVGEGVLELKIDYGPGYRVYLGLVGHRVVLLLTGGDKSTQGKDIRQAKDYWLDYRTKHL